MLYKFTSYTESMLSRQGMERFASPSMGNRCQSIDKATWNMARATRWLAVIYFKLPVSFFVITNHLFFNSIPISMKTLQESLPLLEYCCQLGRNHGTRRSSSLQMDLVVATVLIPFLSLLISEHLELCTAYLLRK